MSPDFITSYPLSKAIWREKYRLRDDDGVGQEESIEETWLRVAKVAAKAEKKGERKAWSERFLAAFSDYEFLPGGRILAGAGTDRRLTLFNCFVMNRIEDDTSSIFDNLREGALTMQRGGGIGMDFSTLRPKGAQVRGVGADASGPVSFMQVWDSMCGTIMSSGARRGAMMATLAVDHPDIETFIDAKSQSGQLRNFNLSVLISDTFMMAVAADADWPLQFAGKVYRTLPARDLFDRIVRATYDQAEPGVIFIDRINERNKLSYCETIYATNPCGEQPLPPYGACMLGSINLARLVREPFEPAARLDEKRLRELVGVAVRFLDNVIDISHYPLQVQRDEAHAKRRIGLGITGLADALAMCNLRYDDKRARKLAAGWMESVQNAAYFTSALLAEEKGVFPLYDAEQYLAHKELRRLQPKVRQAIEQKGLRNGLLTSVAPTGTISLLAGNVSGGIEPIFDLSYRRAVRHDRDRIDEEHIEDYAYRLFRYLKGPEAMLPDAFVTAQQLTPRDHLLMQAALQPHVDSAISKTINCPQEISFDAFRSVYADAYELGLKGCTTYRPNPVTGSVLSSGTGAVMTVPAQADLADKVREDGGVFYLEEPMERSRALAGYTYKLKWPESEHAIYITINDVEHNGRRRPFEIFINSKNLEHYAWTVALTRMISAVFRRGGDVSFVVEELKAVFDPRGGQWMNGHYVPSLLAAIGEIVEKHMIDIGFLVKDDKRLDENSEAAEAGKTLEVRGGVGRDRPARYCPRCSHAALVYQEGCHTCHHCGYSKCS